MHTYTHVRVRACVCALRACVRAFSVTVILLYIFSPENLTNFAIGGVAVQSSTSGGYEASRAIDGNADGILSHYSCAMTDTEDNPWWMVTLRRNGYIKEVHVTTRADCCGESLTECRPTDRENPSMDLLMWGFIF